MSTCKKLSNLRAATLSYDAISQIYLCMKHFLEDDAYFRASCIILDIYNFCIPPKLSIVNGAIYCSNASEFWWSTFFTCVQLSFLKALVKTMDQNGCVTCRIQTGRCLDSEILVSFQGQRDDTILLQTCLWFQQVLGFCRSSTVRASPAALSL